MIQQSRGDAKWNGEVNAPNRFLDPQIWPAALRFSVRLCWHHSCPCYTNHTAPQSRWMKGNSWAGVAAVLISSRLFRRVPEHLISSASVNIILGRFTLLREA